MRTASLGALLLLGGCATADDPKLLDVTRNYASYGKVDNNDRWAVTDCRAPEPAPPRVSASRDLETHGRKLYYLFAKNREAYRMAKELLQPQGQAVVKESWIPAATSTSQKPVTGQRGPLFVMVKTGEPDSDEGWIYATATPDGRTITSSGKLASCMECHQGAKHDRLFAVKCN